MVQEYIRGYFFLKRGPVRTLFLHNKGQQNLALSTEKEKNTDTVTAASVVLDAGFSINWGYRQSSG